MTLIKWMLNFDDLLMQDYFCLLSLCSLKEKKTRVKLELLTADLTRHSRLTFVIQLFILDSYTFIYIQQRNWLFAV